MRSVEPFISLWYNQFSKDDCQLSPSGNTKEKGLISVKKLPVWVKAPLLMTINALPFVILVFLYECGAPLDVLVFPPVAAGLILLNHYACEKVTGFVLAQAYMGLCIFFKGNFSTYLYYHNISSDWATPVVGKLTVFAELCVIMLATGGIVLGEYLQNRKKKEPVEE